MRGIWCDVLVVFRGLSSVERTFDRFDRGTFSGKYNHMVVDRGYLCSVYLVNISRFRMVSVVHFKRLL